MTTAAGDMDEATRALVFDEMSDAILIADDQRRYVDVNRAACALFGRNRDELIGLRIDDVMPRGPDVDLDDLWRTFLAEGTQQGEFRLTRGGETVVIEYRARARVAPGRHISVLRDVTDRVRARDAAEEARAILDSLLMTAPIGFAFLDRELRFRLVNPTLAAMNGLTVEAHLGRTPMELLPGLAANFVREHAHRVFATGEPLRDLELVGETPARVGVRRTWVEQWYPVRLDGVIIGVGMVVEEVTERREREAQLRIAGELRDRLMAIVSHDLRNPLSAITTAAEIIGLDSDAPKKIVTMASRISKASQRMTSLIEQLLDYVRIDQAGRLVLHRSPLDLSGLAQRTAEEFELAFPEAEVEVRAEGNTVGSWDEDRILQVLSNLVGNAVQHGGGRALVRIDGRDEGTVRLEVENRGPPIPAELVPIIFDPFQRGDAGFARRGGLGLGLHISKSIVESHRGTLGVRSDQASTVFSVVLPRR